MAVDAALIEILREALAPLGAVSIRRMFGGAGLYVDGHVIALLDDDIVYLKVSDDTRPRFLAEGMSPFMYATKARTVTVDSYWRMPEWLLDEPDILAQWGADALAVARSVAVSTTPRRRPAKKSAGRKSDRRR
ncbi:MAG: TfoX/Sxy family protein [Hyphomicrobium sp.]